MMKGDTQMTTARPNPPAAVPVVCNGCLVLIDPAWEPMIRIGEFAFHQKCTPRCHECGGPLAYLPGSDATEFYVLDSRVEFIPASGYQVQLTVCCCPECYAQALRDDPSALA